MPRTHRPQAAKPHTFPEQERAPRKKRYLVTGKQPVGGVAPGAYVDIAFTEGQERILLEAGCVEIAPLPEPASESAPKASHTKWATTKKNRPSKADTTEQE